MDDSFVCEWCLGTLFDLAAWMLWNKIRASLGKSPKAFTWGNTLFSPVRGIPLALIWRWAR